MGILSNLPKYQNPKKIDNEFTIPQLFNIVKNKVVDFYSIGKNKVDNIVTNDKMNNFYSLYTDDNKNKIDIANKSNNVVSSESTFPIRHVNIIPLTESGYDNIKVQENGGPARGLYQMEKSYYKGIVNSKNYLTYKKEYKEKYNKDFPVGYDNLLKSLDAQNFIVGKMLKENNEKYNNFNSDVPDYIIPSILHHSPVMSQNANNKNLRTKDGKSIIINNTDWGNGMSKYEESALSKFDIDNNKILDIDEYNSMKIGKILYENNTNKNKYSDYINTLNIPNDKKKLYFDNYNKVFNRNKKQSGGSISELGYSDNSPYKNAPFLPIQGNNITMRNTGKDLIGIGLNKQNKPIQTINMPKYSGEYKFGKDVAKVIEVPKYNIFKRK